MKHRTLGLIAVLFVSTWISACGGGSSQAPAGEAAAAKPAETAAPAPEAGKKGFQKIGDFLDAWSALYDQNEAAINGYEGLPIMELVTPPMTFIGTVQFDILNPENKDGRFEGTLMLAGKKAAMERSGSKVIFGYDLVLEKDGFGPLAKAGDRQVLKGSLDLDPGYYRAEESTERNGKMIVRSFHEFKRLGDGSIICFVFRGQTINARGDEETSDDVIYIHNGKDKYDFVVGKGTAGPGFAALSFADKGDLTKDQAVEMLKTVGYKIEKRGGVRDGKLFLD